MLTGGPDDDPIFLRPEDADTVSYVGTDVRPEFDEELATWNDPGVAGVPHEDSADAPLPPAGKGPSRGYRERWRAIARLHALGHTSGQIGAKLGYSPAGVSLALKQQFVQEEVQRFRTAYETDITMQVREAAIDGMQRIHRIILDPAEKSTTALDASKWAVEKASGKARQEVTVESGTLTTFMQLLQEMRSRGEPIDVSPPALAGHTDTKQAQGSDTAQHDARFDQWITDNLG